MSGVTIRCNWDERPAVIEWVCWSPGATVWLCKFCYGDWAHRACLAPSVLWPQRVKELEPGYAAFLEKVRRETFDVHLLHTTTPRVTKELAATLKRKYDIDMKVTA